MYVWAFWCGCLAITTVSHFRLVFKNPLLPLVLLIAVVVGVVVGARVTIGVIVGVGGHSKIVFHKNFHICKTLFLIIKPEEVNTWKAISMEEPNAEKTAKIPIRIAL